MKFSRPDRRKLDRIFEDRIRAFNTPYRYYLVAAHRFVAYLEANFPQVHHLSQLRRDPHLLGWFQGLCDEDPPLSNFTRRIYLIALRRLLKDLASDGHAVEPGLILPEDFAPRPPRFTRWTLQQQRQPQPQARHKKNSQPQEQIPRKNAPRSQSHPFQAILEGQIHTLAAPLRLYRIAARRFLCYLQKEFPQLVQLSELRRDPHLLGWVHALSAETPPLSDSTRRIYLLCLRRLLRACGDAAPPELILPQDFPAPPPRPPIPPRPKPAPAPLPHSLFGKMFEDLIRTLATTLEPSTVVGYRSTSRHFLSYLQTEFPEVTQLSELRRHPHMVGWFRHLCQKAPPLSNSTRVNHLYRFRRMLYDFAAQGHAILPGMILREDFPQCPCYLPRALSPEDDQRLQEELRRSNDLISNALLLTRATGIRIGECIDLSENCLRSVGPDHWALHVPLGKLHTERLVPVDAHTRQILTRILALRTQAPALHLARSRGLLLPRSASRNTFYQVLADTLRTAGKRAACPSVSCHQLRHTFASEMVRLGISLPALMQLLGHKDIRMTMRYVQVTQLDLQREFHLAHTIHHYQIPQLPHLSAATTSDLPGIRTAVKAARHLLEMYRRQLHDEKARRKAQRLDKRLLRVAKELDCLGTA